MSNFVVHAPRLAEKPGVNSDDGTTTIPVTLSLVTWIGLVVLVSVLVTAWQDLARQGQDARLCHRCRDPG